MNQIVPLIIVVVAAAVIAFPILVLLNINPFAEWGHTIAASLTSFNFAGVPASIWGLVGGLGAASGISAALGYIVKELKKKVTSVTSQFTNLQTSSSNQISQLQKETADVQTASTTKINALTEENSLISTQANQIKNELETTKQSLAAQIKASEELAKLERAKWEGSLTSNTLYKNAQTGAQIITVEKKVVV